MCHKITKRAQRFQVKSPPSCLFIPQSFAAHYILHVQSKGKFSGSRCGEPSELSMVISFGPISVNSQPGGQNNKIVLHLKGLFLSGEKTTIVCPPDWELLKWVYSCAFCRWITSFFLMD